MAPYQGGGWDKEGVGRVEGACVEGECSHTGEEVPGKQRGGGDEEGQVVGDTAGQITDEVEGGDEVEQLQAVGAVGGEGVVVRMPLRDFSHALKVAKSSKRNQGLLEKKVRKEKSLLKNWLADV